MKSGHLPPQSSPQKIKIAVTLMQNKAQKAYLQRISWLLVAFLNATLYSYRVTALGCLKNKERKKERKKERMKER